MNNAQTAVHSFLTNYKTQLESLDTTPVDQTKLNTVVQQLLVGFQQLSHRLQKEAPPDFILNLLQPLETCLMKAKKGVAHSHDLKPIEKILAQHYEQLIHGLRQHHSWKTIVQKVGTLRPKNYSRNIVHIGNALIAFALYEWLFDRSQTIFWLSLFWLAYIILDFTRRHSPRLNHFIFEKILGAVTRPRELYQTPSGIWYVGGLLCAALLVPQTAALCAVLTLGFGDPAASFFGKNLGRISIGQNRTLIGSLSFILVTQIVVMTFLVGMRNFDLATAFWWASICGVSGSIAEYVSNDIFDDNLMIPLAVSIALGSSFGFLLF